MTGCNASWVRNNAFWTHTAGTVALRFAGVDAHRGGARTV